MVQAYYVCVRVPEMVLPEYADHALWLGPLADPVTASALADRFRTTYAHKSPIVSLHPEVPADVQPVPVDDAFLANPAPANAVFDVFEQRAAREHSGDPTAFHNDPAGAIAYMRKVRGTEHLATPTPATLPTAPSSDARDMTAPVVAGDDEPVDWRAIFLTYATHVGTCEGVDFLSDDWDAQDKFTPAEWAAIRAALNEA